MASDACRAAASSVGWTPVWAASARATTVDDIASEVSAALKRTGPTVLEIRIDPIVPSLI